MSRTKKGDNTRQVVRIGLDIAKSSFQVHGVDAHGKVALRKQLPRGKVLGYFAQLPPCLVGLEYGAVARNDLPCGYGAIRAGLATDSGDRESARDGGSFLVYPLFPGAGSR